MATILVPATGPQLSLSFGVGGGQPGTNSIPNTSAKLREHIFNRVAMLEKLFAPITFKMIADAIKISGATETCFIARNSSVVCLRQLILEIETHSPKAIVALDMNLRGPEVEIGAVCRVLLMMVLRKAPQELRSRIAVRHGRFVVTVPIDPVVQIEVGTLDVPPVVRSFVLQEEVAHLLPMLNELDRPHTIKLSIAA